MRGVIVMRSRCFQAAVPRCSDAVSWSQLLAFLADSAARDADIMFVTTEEMPVFRTIARRVAYTIMNLERCLLPRIMFGIGLLMFFLIR